MTTRRILAATALLVAAGLAARAAEDDEKPANPFGDVKAARPDAVPGKLVLSDGKEFRGKLYLTRDKKLEVFEDARNEWHKLKLAELSRVAFTVEKEETVKEWRWKEAGSDVKVETGRTKLDRRFLCTVTTAEGKKIEGHVQGTVIYVEEKEGAEPQRFFLHKDQPSDFGQKPEELVYVKEIVFGEAAAREPEKKSVTVIAVPKSLPPFDEEEAAQPEKPEALTPDQLKVVAPVVESLAEKLAALGGKYPELKAFDAKLVKKRPNGIGFAYEHNFTRPQTKRGLQPSDFGEHGVMVTFWCAKKPDPRLYVSATGALVTSLANLGIDLEIEFRAGAEPSKGFVEEVGGLIKEHHQKFEEADAKAKKDGKATP